MDDQNTRFFHQSMMIRRSTKYIRQLRESDRRVVKDNVEIKEQIFQFFISRWTAYLGKDGPLQGSKIDYYIFDEENETMTRPVSIVKVWEALWSLGGDKAPGPHGFPPHFFPSLLAYCWRRGGGGLGGF